ncbi:MAG: CARDB domain-containing protein, partial [Pseudomonadota bacterium]
MKRLLARLSLVLMIVFASGASAQVRDTKPPRESPPRDQSSPRDQSTPRDQSSPRDKSAPTDKVATSPRPDLYPAAGGFDPEDETSWILLVGNQGSAPSAATNVRFFLRLTNDDDKITGEIPLPALDEGDTHELKLTSIIPTTLIKSLYARIDQPAAVTELNEKNNTFVFKSGRSANADDHS